MIVAALLAAVATLATPECPECPDTELPAVIAQEKTVADARKPERPVALDLSDVAAGVPQPISPSRSANCLA